MHKWHVVNVDEGKAGETLEGLEGQGFKIQTVHWFSHGGYVKVGIAASKEAPRPPSSAAPPPPPPLHTTEDPTEF